MTHISKKTKRTAGILLYIAVLMFVLLLHVTDRNPGNLYLGPSDSVRSNIEPVDLFDSGEGSGGEVVLPVHCSEQEPLLWGVSVRMELAEEDRIRNTDRYTNTITGIWKDTDRVA